MSVSRLLRLAHSLDHNPCAGGLLEEARHLGHRPANVDHVANLRKLLGDVPGDGGHRRATASRLERHMPRRHARSVSESRREGAEVIAPAIPLADVLEKDWQAQIVQLARQLGFHRCYHTFNSRRSAHGFPDLILLRDRLVAVELKRETGKLTVEQAGWIHALLAAEVETYVLRPRNLEQAALVLAARRDPIGGHLTQPRARDAEQQLLTELRKEIDR